MTQLTHKTYLETTSCWCGIALAIPVSLYNEMQDSGVSAYCPLGHTFVFGNTYKKRMEEERAARLRAEQRAQANRDLLHAEERSHASTRGHLTRTKKRIGNGSCPCCNRHFANVERHMANKHPDYVIGVA